ncbi:hypothetical protein EXIGLDRAFT_777725 [Exidia glandulosa HHB12029]|uniref:Uncharacterized protein n=1 Tax=Exidia glandulosa HHB12029 TaxID=1314781 RepID=A0A165CWB1_EXIGL|nr:hypothetical protein EXIGLDRAFT_777725 [Exidia glandulosa HHB12029]
MSNDPFAEFRSTPAAPPRQDFDEFRTHSHRPQESDAFKGLHEAPKDAPARQAFPEFGSHAQSTANITKTSKESDGFGDFQGSAPYSVPHNEFREFTAGAEQQPAKTQPK